MNSQELIAWCQELKSLNRAIIFKSRLAKAKSIESRITASQLKFESKEIRIQSQKIRQFKDISRSE